MFCNFGLIFRQVRAILASIDMHHICVGINIYESFYYNYIIYMHSVCVRVCAFILRKFYFRWSLSSSNSNSSGSGSVSVSDGVDGGGDGSSSDGNIIVLYKYILWLCIACTFKQSTDRTRTKYIEYKMRKKKTKKKKTKKNENEWNTKRNSNNNVQITPSQKILIVMRICNISIGWSSEFSYIWIASILGILHARITYTIKWNTSCSFLRSIDIGKGQAAMCERDREEASECMKQTDDRVGERERESREQRKECNVKWTQYLRG